MLTPLPELAATAARKVMVKQRGNKARAAPLSQLAKHHQQQQQQPNLMVAWAL